MPMLRFLTSEVVRMIFSIGEDKAVESSHIWPSELILAQVLKKTNPCGGIGSICKISRGCFAAEYQVK